MGRDISAMGKLWDEATPQERKLMLSIRFMSDASLEKHCVKSWASLPANFKGQLLEVAAQLFRAEIQRRLMLR